LRVADHDKGVVRFLYQFAGASRTQRWAGRKVQTQNLPRTPKNIENYELLSQATELVRAGDYDALELFAGEVMNTLVGTVRSAFRAPEGYEFVVCDLSSIESCVIGWLFNCKRLLQVFRSGLDAYKDFATILYNVEYEEVTKEQRNICKPPVLGAGYRLGGGELTKEGKKTGLWGYAENMGIKLTQDESHKAVHVFRHAYHEIPKGWHDIEDKVEACVTTGISQRLGHLRFEMDGPFMKMILPSNRPIFYYKPQMRQMKWADGTPRKRLSFTYMGQHQKTGQWIRMENHGGRFTEQSVQGIARDVLAEGIKAAHAEEFRIVGHVHDEIKTLRRIGANRHDVAHLRECMIRPLAWAPGLPLNAAGWSGPIYRKD
jgi:DNA polymerase